MNKLLFQMLLSVIYFFALSACGGKNKSPENVRELMENEGWTFCKTVIADCYFEGNGQDPWIYEDCGLYDLFERSNGDFKQYVITRPNTDDISLKDYDKKSESDCFKANYWINYHVEKGVYTLRADHARSGSGRLGLVTKYYTGRAVSSSSLGIVYLNIQYPYNRSTEADEPTSNHESESPNEETEEPMKKYKQCGICYSSGKCSACGGTGTVYNSIDYSPGQYVDCGACGGSGVCSLCEGSGSVEDFGW